MSTANTRLPDFLIAGAAKSGTTTLYHSLRQHPQVFLPSLKEPVFLAKGLKVPPIIHHHRKTEIITELQEYIHIFSQADKDQITGEASTIYFQCPERVVQNMQKYSMDPSQIKIIIILRNPVERVFSAYMMLRQAGVDKREFSDAIRYESIYRKFGYEWDPLDYIDFMMTSKRLRFYMDFFPMCKICFLEDLISSPENFMKDLFDFLEVETGFKIKNVKKINLTGIPRIRVLDRLLRKPDPVKALLPGVVHFLSDESKQTIIDKLISFNTKTSHTMDDADRKYLTTIFAKDIRDTGDLLNRDLSHWTDPPAEK